MNEKNVQLFENQPIRAAWDEGKEEWYFSVVDVVGILTEQTTARGASNYWAKLKERLKKEGADPEQAIDRALASYLKKGYSREWINQRLQAIQVRKELTDEWQDRGVKQVRYEASACGSDENFIRGAGE